MLEELKGWMSETVFFSGVYEWILHRFKKIILLHIQAFKYPDFNTKTVNIFKH